MQRALTTTSLPLVAVAAAATILAAPAGADPTDQSAAPTTPAQPQPSDNSQLPPQDTPSPQPNTPSPQPNTPQQQPGTVTPPPQGNTTPSPSQPGVNTPQPGVTTPQPGVTTPQPGVTNPNSPNNPEQGLAGPSQPGVTTPRVAPLPVPGQQPPAGPVQPAVVPGQNGPNAVQPDQITPPPGQGGTVRPAQPGQGGSDSLAGNGGPAVTAPPQTQWASPSLQGAPAAPVVPITGPHTEVAANVDGGTVLPGYVANTHHFSNLDGYVGTVGYSTPNGSGDAGISVEFVEANKIKVTTYTHNSGVDDVKNETYIDTTQPNMAKAAVENWIRSQPGGIAALDAAAQVGRLPAGELAPLTADVGGVTAQVGGDVQY
ncbi:hypothetical protein [Nocardia sp. alder85J]|uniref:hypothetical protein n=1 Tax=Nocardia sp. alder85J TaxID=2862949 RepID=UPI001CD491EA|nr:hypothetical protein [Nocardia sp. alder85J]MCX4097262.1 hypothetical protein [Nocardia sp. alder85J]